MKTEKINAMSGNFYVDDLGRMVVTEENLLIAISGALSSGVLEAGDNGTNLFCPYMNPGCGNNHC
jgi:hypothetical protein